MDQELTEETQLPPAGHKRSEELRKRKDKLEQAGDERAAELETERIDPSKLRVENEIAQHFDTATLMLKVSEADSAYMYCWVYSGSHGIRITEKRIEGWEVVQGDDPEALEHKGIGADTTRRIGDTLLMRITKDRHFLLERKNKEKANRFNTQATSLSDTAEKLARKHNIPIYNDGELDPRTLDRMMKRAAAKQTAGRALDRMIRQGRMPGL